MVRGPYVRLTAEKLSAIHAKLRRHPTISAPKLKRVFGVRLRTAYRLKAEFADLGPNDDFHPCKKRGRKAVTRPMLEAKIRTVLSIDCTLTLNGMVKMIRRRYRTVVSRKMVRNVLKRMKWTKKRISRVPYSRHVPSTIAARRSFA